jgi:hypothetical protein
MTQPPSTYKQMRMVNRTNPDQITVEMGAQSVSPRERYHVVNRWTQIMDQYPNLDLVIEERTVTQQFTDWEPAS